MFKLGELWIGLYLGVERNTVPDQHMFHNQEGMVGVPMYSLVQELLIDQGNLKCDGGGGLLREGVCCR